MEKINLEDQEIKVPTKREEVVMNAIWKVFVDANDDSIMLNFDEMNKIEVILLNYKQPN